MSTDNTTNFDKLNLHPSILRAIQESGYTQATPIQAQAIPEVMAGHDLMASAQTGTGKTAAFTLPALNLLATPHPVKSRGPRILVLVPTRELAAQVNDAARKYGKFIRARTVSIVGGMPYPLQNKLLSQPIDILVATPGRLIDHMERGRIDMSRLQMLVLDEADRMLDMGFMPDIEHICAALPAERQNLLFSATFEQSIVRVAQQILKNPKRIEIAAQTQKHENIEQRLHYVDDMGHKNKLLEHLLIDPEVNQAIIFTSTKRHADVLADDLYAAGHRTAALHGDMTQGARNRTLTKLRHGDVKVLVATDVAARGIDVAGISHVINYDLPKQAEDYVHRIGRTGRAGNTGIAISFASNADRYQVRKIEQFTGQRLEPSVIAGLEPKRTAPRNDGPRGGRPGGRSNGNKRPYGERNYNERGQRGDRPEHFSRERSSNDRGFGDRSFGQEHRFHGKDSAVTEKGTGFNNGFKTRSQDGQREGNRHQRGQFADGNRNGNRQPRTNDERGSKFGGQNRQRDSRHHEGRQREDAGQRRSRNYA